VRIKIIIISVWEFWRLHFRDQSRYREGWAEWFLATTPMRDQPLDAAIEDRSPSEDGLQDATVEKNISAVAPKF
jgi:hypothetical protein